MISSAPQPEHRRAGVLPLLHPDPDHAGQLITVAGRRWSIEESFQSSKGLAGLDEHQVRRWTPWRRWTLLAMLAHALLAVLTAAEREHSPFDGGLIDLTCAEVRRLLTAALAPLTAPADALTHTADWSRWRRDHRHRARTCHYARYGVSSHDQRSTTAVLAFGRHLRAADRRKRYGSNPNLPTSSGPPG
jgi:hypothetical protein